MLQNKARKRLVKFIYFLVTLILFILQLKKKHLDSVLVLFSFLVDVMQWELGIDMLGVSDSKPIIA